MPPLDQAARLDLAALRARLASMPAGRSVWRSLDEIAATPAFLRLLEREYPAVTDLNSGPDRRGFLRLMAASLAMSGLLGAAAKADERDLEIPFVNQPEHAEPSARLSFASVALVGGFANGVLVTTRDGRPFKIEGNPQHPWTRGGTDIFAQASVLGLYDPQRSQTVRFRGRPSDWQAFRGATIGPVAALKAEGGAGFCLLTGPVTSPSLLAQINSLQQKFPGMRWYSHAPLDRFALYEGTRRAFGQALETRWRFDRAEVIVSLDGDFLDHGPQQIGVSRDWIEARRRAMAKGSLLELHAATSVPNLTSAKADYAASATPDEIAALARGLLDENSQVASPAGLNRSLEAWRLRAAAALRHAAGAGLVIVGAQQPASVQEAVHRLNHALGHTDRSVFYTAPVGATTAPLAELATAMERGNVKLLLMLDTNPAYDSAGEMDFAALLEKVPVKIHAGLYQDETANRSDWHLPLAHPLESWGDGRALDGTVGLMQPTIAPLYGGRSAAELLSLITDAEPRGGLVLLRTYWQGARSDAAFALQWQRMLQDGFIAESAHPPQPVQLQPAKTAASAAGKHDGLDLLIRADPSVLDGAWANNAWLQELPRPLTKLVWNNVITVSPALAEQAHLSQGDLVELTVRGRSIEGPVWILPGQAEGSVAITLGYGRRVPEMLFDGVGHDAYRLRAVADPWHLTGASLRATGKREALVSTQNHATMEGHDFVRVQPIGAAPVGEQASFSQPSLYGASQTDHRAWGMVIDLDACIGCNACVTACQSENNIAVVGAEQVAQGREMHWLRIDRYYEGGLDDPRTHFQPVLCMHCEHAPCEVGCPVEATLHDSEGLNLMVYNRCIGTRACSGYCPYKVRHFNYLDYSAGAAPTISLQRNPDVTVRARGVMEKCTFCVQRIVEARIESDKSNEPIPDGRVQTACQNACPTRAITFGDLNDQGSSVASLRHDPRHYALLGELNTRPRTTYLAKAAPAKDEG